MEVVMNPLMSQCSFNSVHCSPSLGINTPALFKSSNGSTSGPFSTHCWSKKNMTLKTTALGNLAESPKALSSFYSDLTP